MTSVECDDNEGGLCYLQIKSIDEVNNITVWNSYLRPPAYQNSTFYYRSGMLQTWNKFCFQGGMLELGATTANGEDASKVTFGPPLYAAFFVLGIVLFLTIVVFVVMGIRRRRKLMKDAEKTKELTYVVADMKSAKIMGSSSEMITFASTDNDDEDEHGDTVQTRRSSLASGPYHRFR
ncbi:Beta-glucan synthesis-associated protein [Phytophthora cinnamomi]|uniref:Beta-glucan synthesis-associated protein n=1 Tax=Phytophthora cinnamomi TaxID=4785 RepID=UPI0035593AE1|nr:Beta-glucan synthesis-associated protein [Phytophthora cinnamomi]